MKNRTFRIHRYVIGRTQVLNALLLSVPLFFIDQIIARLIWADIIDPFFVKQFLSFRYEYGWIVPHVSLKVDIFNDMLYYTNIGTWVWVTQVVAAAILIAYFVAITATTRKENKKPVYARRNTSS